MSVFTVGKRYMGEYLVEHVVPFFNGELAVSQALNENYYLQSIYLNRMISTIEFERIRNWYDGLDHPLLINFSDLFMDQRSLVFVYPYQALQPLPEAIAKSGIEEEQVVQWMKDLVDLEIYLRSQDVPMFYVKDPRNIGLNESGELKVISSGVDDITPYPADLNWGTFMYSIATGEYMDASVNKMPKNNSLSRSMSRLLQKGFKARSLQAVQRHIDQYLKSSSNKGKGLFDGIFGGKKEPNNQADIQPSTPTKEKPPAEMKPVKSELLLTEPSLEPVKEFDPQDLLQPSTDPPVPPNQPDVEQEDLSVENQTSEPTDQQQDNSQSGTAMEWENLDQPDLQQTAVDMQLEELYKTFTEEQQSANQAVSTTPSAEEQEFAEWANANENQSTTPSVDEDLFKELNVTQEELEQLMAEQQATQEPLPEDWSQIEGASTQMPNEQWELESTPAWPPTDDEETQEDYDLMEEGPMIDWSNTYDPNQVNEQLVSSNQSKDEVGSFEQISQSLEELERELQGNLGADSALQNEPEFTVPSTEEEMISEDPTLKNLDDLFNQFESIQKDIQNEQPEPAPITQTAEELDKLAQELADLQRDLSKRELDEAASVEEESSKNIDEMLHEAFDSITPQQSEVEKNNDNPIVSKQLTTEPPDSTETGDPFAKLRFEFEEKQKQVVDSQQIEFEQRKQELINRAEEELKQRKEELRKEIELQEQKILADLETALAQQEEEQQRLLQEEQSRIEKDLLERERIERQKAELAELRKKHEQEEEEALQQLRDNYSLKEQEQIEAINQERDEWEKKEQARMKKERKAFKKRKKTMIHSIKQELAKEEKKIKAQNQQKWDQLMHERQQEFPDIHTDKNSQNDKKDKETQIPVFADQSSSEGQNNSA